jgi:hypothetical protein
MLVVLFLNIFDNLLKYNFQATKVFIEKLIDEKSSYDELVNIINKEPVALNYGLSVLLEIHENMKFYFYNNTKNNKDLINITFSELKQSVLSLIRMNEMLLLLDSGKCVLNRQFFDEFFEHRTKRLNATLMILSDLAFSQEPINKGSMNPLLSLGKFTEIKITLLRDYSRRNVNNDFNILG